MGRNGVRFALDQSEQVWRSRLGGKVVHLVVEQESESRNRHAVAISAVQRVSQRHGVALGVDDVEVCRLAGFVRRCVSMPDHVARRCSRRVDRGSQPSQVLRVQETLHGHAHKVRIAQELGAIGVGAPHHFGEIVRRGGRACAGLFIARSFEHRQHFQHCNAARRGGRRSDDAVTLVFAFQRLTLDSAIILQIVESDQPAVRLHRFGQAASRLALVEVLGAVARNAVKRLGQLRLNELFTGLPAAPWLQENALRFGKLLEQPGVAADRPCLGVREFKAVGGKVHGRLDEFRPRLAAVLLMCEFQPANRARNTRGPPADQAVPRWLARGVEVHVMCRSTRSGFAEVDECRASVGKTGQQKPSSADVSSEGVGHRKGERDRDRGVHGVAASLQHGHARVGRIGLLRHDHCVAGPDRLTSRQQGRDCRNQRKNRRKTSESHEF